MTTNLLDMIVGGAVVIGVFVGLRKGLVREVAGFIALAVGIVGARVLTPYLIPWIEQNLQTTLEWSRLIAWCACFFGLGWVVNLIACFATRMLGMMALGGVNKLLGAAFGGIKYILLFSILFNAVEWTEQRIELPGKELREKSLLYRPVLDVASWSFSQLGVIRERIEERRQSSPANPLPTGDTSSETRYREV
jgi:membrane protein required for colicin V production